MIDDDLLAPATLADPYPVLARLREESPVHWSERYRAWLLTGHADCDAAHTDGRFSSDRITPMLAKLETDGEPEELLATLRVLAGWMTFKDGPPHRRLRALVLRAFTPRTVERLHDRVTAITDELLATTGDQDELDVVAAVAHPLPAIVIAELLGVPAADRDRFKAWSTDVAALVFGAVDDDSRHARASQGMAELVAYLSALVHGARGRDDDDLLVLLVGARTSDGDVLTHDEIVAMCTLLLFGGHETTTNLLGSGVLALLDHPDQADRLREDPSLTATAVEELLRFDGPARISARVAREDFVLHGHAIAAGQRIFLVLAAANRDPTRFTDPDALDVGRDPNPHLGFGLGQHYCLGAPLARLEARIAIPRIMRRLDGMQRTPGPLRWQPTLISRSLVALPVVRRPRA